ncbi:pyruvate, water dikinase regulatory protein [Crassaminicella indica]|uniref:Putative pyruvate, phosphate dikinase regulatory protein n=1 Tax=Crassaminicella indica TaxID=2855394 RepID=A0ABX8RDB0_9CLOT|nr:pyruvate, water dikinase regulatory protein [Crassaminicella indica]QXM05710.1 kinase/pyrophosphorylase [Crassaminicella indica]
MNSRLVVYVISDSIGETGEQVVKAAISQFVCKDCEIRRFPYISEEEQILEIINEAKNEKSMIVFTIVIPSLRKILLEKAKEHNIIAVDAMTPIVEALEKSLNEQPKNEPGLIRKLDEKYFKKIEAIEFAVKYDDGKDPRGLKKADIVLIGISRTSKTPLSMYLAHKNIKVANVPLVPEVVVPDELFEISPRKIIGLTTNPIKLNEIRQERLKALGLRNEANYASMDRILKELDYAENLMKRIGCPIIDVSSKAIEESARIILEIIKEND